MSTLNARIRTIGLLGIALIAIGALHLLTVEKATDSANAAYAQCHDGIDNDGNGLIDYPQDKGCHGLHDNFEGPNSRGVFVKVYDGKEFAAPGDRLTYTIELTTNRPDHQSTGVQFLLPAKANYVSSSNNGALNGNYIQWKDVIVYPTSPRYLTVVVTVPHHPHGRHPEATLIAEAKVGTEHATDATRIVPKTLPKNNTSVKITVDDGKTYVQQNELLTYRIAVKGNEPYAQNVTVGVQIPVELTLHQATGGHTKNHRGIQWQNVALEPGEVREFYVSAHVRRDTSDYQTIRLRAYVGKEVATDNTTVGGRAIATNKVDLSITDGQRGAAHGDVLNYEIRVYNAGAGVITNLDVNASLPAHTEFVDSNAGGYWTGSNVRWDNLTVSPRDARILNYSVRVRSDARPGALMRAGAVAAGHEAYDVTEVAGTTIVDAVEPALPAGVALKELYASRVLPQPALRPHGALSKVADRSEVHPGDIVGYTVRLRNNTNHPFHNVRIQDQFDGRYMRAVGQTRGSVSQDTIVWEIPSLQPGQEWSQRYRMQIASNAPHAMQINNKVSASGEGLEHVSLTERVFTSQIGVLTHLPATGYGIEHIFLALTALLGLAPVCRRLGNIAIA